jgi:hypothetical protein
MKKKKRVQEMVAIGCECMLAGRQDVQSRCVGR